MSRLPVVNFMIMEKVIKKMGFVLIRNKGSHFLYRHPDGRCTTLPYHGNRDLARPLLREILREIELSPQEFLEAIERS